MLGIIVNVLAIVIGGLVGTLVRGGLKDRYKDVAMEGIALTVIVIGVLGAIKSENMILVIISIVLGGIIGEAIGIEVKLDRIGKELESRFGRGNSDFSKGFVTVSLIYCSGAMAIVGALESGLLGNHNTLFAKSTLDGITSIIFASTMGHGVIFAAIPVLIYEGAIMFSATLLKDVLVPGVILEMSAVGGILIMGIGIDILGIRKIKTGSMIPGIFIPLIYFVFRSFLGI